MKRSQGITFASMADATAAAARLRAGEPLTAVVKPALCGRCLFMADMSIPLVNGLCPNVSRH